MSLIKSIRENAQQLNKCIILAEGTEERTLKAADFILKEKLARLILLGSKSVISAMSLQFGLKYTHEARIIDPEENPDHDRHADLLYELRKSKGLTREEAAELAKDPLYLAALLIKSGEADGEVAGAINSTGNVLKPAFQVIRTLPGIQVVSGAFIMIFKANPYVPENIMVFADCAVNPDPTAAELAQIAISTAQTARNIAHIEPRVAMLSFSTKGSAKHVLCDKVVEATRLAREMDPDLPIDGEMQADTAIVESVGMHKAPGSNIAGKANVLVFPGLESGNIAYKLVQRLAGAEAIGPILQGMAAPINDLSRGCSVSDIVNLVAITANQCAKI